MGSLRDRHEFAAQATHIARTAVVAVIPAQMDDLIENGTQGRNHNAVAFVDRRIQSGPQPMHALSRVVECLARQPQGGNWR